MSIRLNVPYSEKETAKAVGAIWDAQYKTWHLPNSRYSQLNQVAAWLPDKEARLILISPVWLLHNKQICWKCQQATPVVAIGTELFYEFDDSSWEEMDFFTVFQGVTYISPDFRAHLQQHYPKYKPAYSKTAEGYYWANHCSHCKSLQGDWFLFDEPGGAFSPISETDAQSIVLNCIKTPYAICITADYSMGDHIDLIADAADWRGPGAG